MKQLYELQRMDLTDLLLYAQKVNIHLFSAEREEIINNYTEYYDLPHDFWNMDYFDFLEARRVLMAKSIRNYFEKL